MCGIVGRMSVGATQADLNPALSRLRHRGPDDSGTSRHDWSGGSLCLGHTRLAIIDLSQAGRQPMTDPDSGVTIVFNGEIYNYRELRSELTRAGCTIRGETDTEVLLQAWIHWGEEALPRLKGMFSFAIYTPRDESLTLVRDAFGIKPLFYSYACDSLSFASEIDALFAASGQARRPNLAVAARYLELGRYDDREMSFFEGVLSVLPGHLMRFIPQQGRLEVRKKRWWWPSIDERRISFADAVDEVRSRFLTNINLHLRSDVAVGAALSGGVDSTAVVSAARRLAPDVPMHAFSFVARGSERNEETWIDLVADNLGLQVHKVHIRPGDLARDLDALIRAQGEPFGSTSIYAQYRVYQQAREVGVTVTLDGQGADELFAGYLGYPTDRIQSLISARNWVQLVQFAVHWPNWPGRSFGMLFPGMASALPRRAKEMLRIFRTVKSNSPRLVDQAGLDSSLGMVPDEWREIPPGRALSARLREALTCGDLSSLLRHGDRNSMRWSIESRVPFLTPDFAEFVLQLPERYLLSNSGETKHVFRHAMSGIAPLEILSRKDKIGFETPEHEWLTSSQSLVREWLDGLDVIPTVDAHACRRFVDDSLSGEAPLTWKTWRVINLARWAQIALA